MESKAVIVADEATGNVIYQSENPNFGYVKVQQTRTIIGDDGFLRRTLMTALIQSPIDILQDMNYYAGQILPGKVIVKESLTPFNKKNPSKDIKVAGRTGIPCTIKGQVIYRKTFYTESSNAEDVRIQHDNVNELRAAYSKIKISDEDFTDVNQEEDFSL